MTQTEFRKRMIARRAAWYDNPAPAPELKQLLRLLNKADARLYIAQLGIDLPQIICADCTVDDIDFDALPRRVVIKPQSATNADGVLLIDGDRELLRGVDVPRAELEAFCQQALTNGATVGNSRLMIEELLADYDPDFAVPRDFKVFCAGGRAWIVQVIDRVGADGYLYRQAFYTARGWQRIMPALKTNIIDGPDIERPRHLKQLIASAERIAKDIGVFIRLDFYITPRGPVFGEASPTPADGWNFTQTGSKMLCALMDHFPDRIPRGWTLERGRPRKLSNLRRDWRAWKKAKRYCLPA